MNFENLFEIEQYGIIGVLEIKNVVNPFLLAGLITLSCLQIAAGVILVMSTLGFGAKLGEFLVCEGISDGIYVAFAGIKGNLSL